MDSCTWAGRRLRYRACASLHTPPACASGLTEPPAPTPPPPRSFLPALLFLYFSFWWPQILLCARHDVRQPLRPEFVLGSSAARLALPLYIFACPSNLLHAAASPGLCVGLVAWVGLQCALLLLQRYRGPRCFIPSVVSRVPSAGRAVLCSGLLYLSARMHLRPPRCMPDPPPLLPTPFLPAHAAPARALRLQPPRAQGCRRRLLRHWLLLGLLRPGPLRLRVPHLPGRGRPE